MKDMIKTVLVLSLIAVIAGALLGFVNSITKVDPEEQLKSKLSLVYPASDELERVEFTPISGELANYGSILDVFATADGTYVIHSSGKGGYGGDIELLIAIKDSYINKIAPYKHSETPGLGTKGFNESYLISYYKDISEIDKFTIVGRASAIDSEIAAITGATYTSNAIANAINVAAFWYNSNVSGGSL